MEQDFEAIERLIAVMEQHDLDRMKVRVGETLYELVRREAAAPVVTQIGHVPAPVLDGSGPAPVAGPPKNVKRVSAPLTGVFYRSSSPDSAAFVNEGQRVEPGDVLCILEAMKLFNEIQSEFAGTIVRIIPQNGELVSQGEDLFWIEP
ncbi:MAG: acetyl-CoA carboxylase biotin carboxyl carrier protein [Candidatus Baltobacteraceae bacterium]